MFGSGDTEWFLSRIHPNHGGKLLSRTAFGVPRSTGWGCRLAVQLDDTASCPILCADAAVEGGAEVRLQFPCRSAYAAAYAGGIPNAALRTQGARQEAERELANRLVHNAAHVCHSAPCAEHPPRSPNSRCYGSEAFLHTYQTYLLLSI